MPWLINASQLDKLRKDQKNVVILDASWHMVKENRHAKEEFLAQHISSARFLDLHAFHDNKTNLSNMLLRDEAILSDAITKLGITPEHKIIFYDQSNLHTSFRACWMFQVFGHPSQQLYVLDGGFEAWKKYGGKIESGEARFGLQKPYNINFQAHFLRTLIQIKSNLHSASEQVIDVRHPVRYSGGPEPRMEMRQGHIPHSFSFPFFTMFDADGRLKSIEKIRKQLTGIGVDLSLPIITMCGSGISAPILNFVLHQMNHTQNSLYDGSWSEWGANSLYVGEKSLDERPIKTSIEQF